MPEPRICAAVDCGTNSLRLLIGETGRGGVRVLRRETRIVGLGRGVDETGRFSPEAVRLALDVLGDYTEEMRAAAVRRVAMVATSASRDAENSAEFIDQARAALGSAVDDPDVRVISGREEARLSFAGAVGGLQAPGPYAVVDVGGGSTELAVGPGLEATAPDPSALLASSAGFVSFDMGCVRLTERFMRSDPPTRAELDQARAYARELLRAAEPEGLAGVRTAVAVAGTALTVAAIALGHTALDPRLLSGARVPISHVVTAAGLISSMTLAERTVLGPMDPGRAPVIPAGAWILAEVGLHLQERSGVAEFLIREEDILDGVLLSLRDSA